MFPSFLFRPFLRSISLRFRAGRIPMFEHEIIISPDLGIFHNYLHQSTSFFVIIQHLTRQFYLLCRFPELLIREQGSLRAGDS